MDVGEEVVQPFADIDLCQFAASHKGVDDSRVLGCIVVAAEEIVLAPQSQRTYAVLYEIIIYHVPTVCGVACQLTDVSQKRSGDGSLIRS